MTCKGGPNSWYRAEAYAYSHNMAKSALWINCLHIRTGPWHICATENSALNSTVWAVHMHALLSDTLEYPTNEL